MAQLPPYISASWLTSFLECPLSYKTQYIDKSWKFQGNIYTAFWNAIHSALEHNYKQKITTKIDLPAKDLVIVFNEALDKKLEEISEKPSDSLDIIRLQGGEMIYKYMNDVAPFIQPATVEFKFEIELKSIWWKILGYIDLITEDGLIIDHKTASAATYQKYTPCYVNWMQQLTMYSLAYRKTYNRIEKGNRIDVLKRLKWWPWFNHVESTRTDQDILNLVNLLSKVKQIIEQDLRYPNLSNCCNCELNQICKKQ